MTQSVNSKLCIKIIGFILFYVMTILIILGLLIILKEEFGNIIMMTIKIVTHIKDVQLNWCIVKIFQI